MADVPDRVLGRDEVVEDARRQIGVGERGAGRLADQVPGGRDEPGRRRAVNVVPGDPHVIGRRRPVQGDGHVRSRRSGQVGRGRRRLAVRVGRLERCHHPQPHVAGLGPRGRRDPGELLNLVLVQVAVDVAQPSEPGPGRRVLIWKRVPEDQLAVLGRRLGPAGDLRAAGDRERGVGDRIELRDGDALELDVERIDREIEFAVEQRALDARFVADAGLVDEHLAAVGWAARRDRNLDDRRGVVALE